MPASSRRFLALYFPFLPSDRLKSRSESASAAPPENAHAFVEKRKSAMRVIAVDPQALAQGIAPGLTLADARARLPELVVYDADPLADLRFLETIADACDRYTPLVALDPPDGVTLDITGCAHLFGGETGLVGDVEVLFAKLHLRHALADTPEAAQALARFQGRPAPDTLAALRRLPVAALRLDDERAVALQRAGLKTIGALADRPVAPLAARFGAQTVDALARLLGRTDSRIVPRRTLPALDFERRFAEPIARIDDALAALAELAAQACEVMTQRDRGGRSFTARLHRSDGIVRRLTVETGQPMRDPAIVMRLFGERIEALSDPIDPGFGFDIVRLGIGTLELLAPTQFALEGGAIAEDALAALVDRLSVRLGRRRVRRFVAVDTHIPEQSAFELPAVETPPPGGWAVPDPAEPPLRPLHLFDPPHRIEVIAEVPDGPPATFRWRRTLHVVARAEGPERIAPEWWRRKHGHDPAREGATRDYYRVEDVRGRRFWLFRHGLYDGAKPLPGWYLHGLFA